MTIESVYRSNSVMNIHTEEGEDYCFKRDHFEEWIDEQGKRDWIEVTPDHRGEPDEKTGTYTWSIYNKLERSEADIKEYIETFKIQSK